ncbi:hypothetical protein ATK36_0483 [Amycolatopsis sulphurea]|uniref:Uncharacterized protein n=1 Tax=Amycolatopsis sulphurea TaxID=76022 RepID=A0A2A9FZP3_9PSEU|nr:hypothetical protein [Amycolatopsis sulphurea]PFG56947.1 hypothetical protein ATK36_0483 [Amycolatopsis sulphurea]
MKNNRYDYAKFGAGFIVVDRRSAQLAALTDRGDWADIDKPGDRRFFALTQSEARRIADQLNRG